MKVHTLAGARRADIIGPHGNGANRPAPAPQYRWTFQTWVKRERRTWNGELRSGTTAHRTMTVLAATEQEAQAKILAALPPEPQPRDTFEVRDERIERHWLLEGHIEEVIA